MTSDELLTSVNAAGFTPATLTAFLVAGKLAIDVAGIEAAIRNEQAARTATDQESEARLQALQAAIAAKQAEIVALGG